MNRCYMTMTGSRRHIFLFIASLLLHTVVVEALVPSANGHSCLKPQPLTTTKKEEAPALSSLDIFAQMRSGISPKEKLGDEVFWTADGELYETPSGKIVARIEGLETSRAIRLKNNAIRIFSRKLVWFLDPETNEIMDEFQGKAVPPIRFDAQVFDVQQGEILPENPLLSTVLPYVVRSKRLIPCMPITPRWGGCNDILMFQVPLFIDVEIPVPGQKEPRKYQAWEFYDYSWNIHQDQKNPPVLSWTRQGSTPPFCVDGNGVTHARGHRVDSFEDLPQSTQDYVNQNYPLFRGPPQSMEEVDRLLGNV